MIDENLFLNFSNRYKYCYLKNSKSDENGSNSLENLYFSIINDVDIVLNLLKIPESKKGVKYWKDAVFILISSKNEDVSICNEIYPTLAKKYSKTSRSIERSMRSCFEDTLYKIAKDKNNKTPIFDFMSNYLVSPKNNELLCRIAELVVSAEFQAQKYKYKPMIIKSDN